MDTTTDAHRTDAHARTTTSRAGCDRGSHQVAIEIVDSAARIIERTPSQPFHVRRITLADKRRINPCQKDDYGVRPECPLSDKPKERDIPLVPFM